MKKNYQRVALALLLFVLSPQVRAELHYLKTTAGNWQELSDQIGILEGTGMHVRHIFPPNELLICVHPSIEPVNLNQEFVVESLTEIDATASVPEKHARRIQLALTHLKSADCDLDSNARAPLHPGPLQMIKLEPDSLLLEEIRSPLISPAEQYNANFMVGRAVVSVIFPESGGNDENWTAAAKQSAFNRVVQGLNWWCDQAEQRNVNISFVYDMHWEITVSFEPVKEWAPEFKALGCVPYSRWDWVNEVLNNLGYGDDWEGVFAHCNSLRKSYKCNWAFELYVANAENEPGHVFYGLGAAGYATRYTRWDYLRCQHYKERPTPMAAVAYSSWWLDQFWTFVAHEVGHVFGAVDEYEADEGQCNSGKCDDRWGYLQVKNGNCINCTQHRLPCVMTENNNDVTCDFTVAHIGWRDTDSDGVSDAIDPNNGDWMSIPNVNLGDLVRIYTVAGDFVNLISVTADNMATQPANYVIWDGHNYDNQICWSDEWYYVTVNNGEPFQRRLRSLDPVNPAFNGVNYSNGNLAWELDNSFAYVRCFIYDASNNLIARPIWDKLYSANYPQSLDMDFLPSGQTYTARFFGWCTDGGKSQTVNYTFTHQCVHCGDANSDGNINISDAVFLITYIFASGTSPADCSYSRGMGDANGDGVVNISDAVYILAYVFVNGSTPPLPGDVSNFPLCRRSSTPDDTAIVAPPETPLGLSLALFYAIL